MKTNLETRIEAAAARFKALGNQALKHPVSSILSLCVLAGVAATAITFSQEGPTGPALPAYRVITASDGRALAGTVVAINGDSIKFRRDSDGKEFDINRDKLSAEDWKWLGWDVKNNTPKAQPHTTPAVSIPEPKTVWELVERIKTDGPSAGIYTQMAAREKEWGAQKGYQAVPITELAKTLTPSPNAAEKISLRPEFEALGIKAANQQKHGWCQLYSGYYLMQYYAKKNQMPLPSLEQVRKEMDRTKIKAATGYSPHDLIRAFARFNPGKTTVHTLAPSWSSGKTGHYVKFSKTAGRLLTIELIKQELRRGQPVLVAGFLKGPHAMLVVGFETPDGRPETTKFEILNSWGADWGDQGYGWIKPQQILSAETPIFNPAL